MSSAKETLSQMKSLSGKIAQEHPEFIKGLSAFADATHAAKTLDTKMVELISIALSVSKQCHYCILFHVRAALEAGATREEMMEAAFVACMMGGGPAWMYAQQVRQAIDELQE
jgi:AhpD family alkylhydroperoxidase